LQPGGGGNRSNPGGGGAGAGAGAGGNRSVGNGPTGNKSLGNAGAFSFQSSKNLACGEGGALVTNDEQVFERAYSMHNAGRSRSAGNRWRHVTLGWNCRPTEYQAALLLHRLRSFDRLQGIRARNFKRLRELMTDIESLEPLAVHRSVRAHGMYMFVMRYKPERCGGLIIDNFLEYVQAEGVPVLRAFEATMSDQPAIRDLITKRQQYFRCLPTPISDQAVRDTVYIAQNVFLGTTADMEDIVAAMKKVERHFSARRITHQPSLGRTP